MAWRIPEERVTRAYQAARSALLAERNASGHWRGELSASALSTATAAMALQMVERNRPSPTTALCVNGIPVSIPTLVGHALEWLASHQNSDGGWGDTTKSLSNVSTTMLAHALFHATGTTDRYRATVVAADAYLKRAGGVTAVVARYGKDKTFSIPILTHCALAGLVDWKEIAPLPFELACVPARMYKWLHLPVVSYALPALIAIGQVRHHHRKPINPLSRIIRGMATGRSLRLLERIQPDGGGFLEAAPLTSFVTMSLAAKGLADHPVVRKGVQFLIQSVRPDGSWPIDTDLATWLTTMSVDALRDDVPPQDRQAVREWLLGQQYRVVHPYTHADPGGWAWTDLPGGVPDADDTPGALLALLTLRAEDSRSTTSPRENTALALAVDWLLNLQNRDRGWPTFCRGWGWLPFDRSAPDISAHVLRALAAWLEFNAGNGDSARLAARARKAVESGFAYLASAQRPDGSWIPLWFGNQFADREENPTYGTARVLAAYRDAGRLTSEPARRGIDWLTMAQNGDGGWGGGWGTPSSVEETALAVQALLSVDTAGAPCQRGLEWLVSRVEGGTFQESSPIGFYFAKLWYFERLYPQILTVAALRRAMQAMRACSAAGQSPQLREGASHCPAST